MGIILKPQNSKTDWVILKTKLQLYLCLFNEYVNLTQKLSNDLKSCLYR